MGGAETWLMEVLRLWSKTAVGQIDFLATSGNSGIFDDEAQQLGAQVHYVRYGRSHLPRFAAEFRRLLRKEKYDAIHDHEDYASGWHFLIADGLLPAVRVTHVHNPWLHIQANYTVGPLRALTAKAGKRLVQTYATHVCGTSEQILREYGFEPNRSANPKVFALHCGFDVGRFNNPRDGDRISVLREFCWPTETKLILFVGRLDRALEFNHPQNHKNSWFALNVLRAAIKKERSIRFLMAGAGDRQREEIEARLQEWGLNDKIRLIGIRNDVPRLMRAADLLFFPSRQEGLGMVAVEAQAAGLPVLASTAVPSECVVIPELYHALALSEHVDKWADALIEILTKLRPTVDVCRSNFESSVFSIHNSARRLAQTYSSLS